MFGPANVFVSHAWMYMFLEDLIGAIEVWISQEPCCSEGEWRFWIDLLVVNQHLDPPQLPDAREEAENFKVFTDGFEGALVQIQRAVIVLSPWDRPHWIFRTWCLFEFYVIMKFQIRYEFVLPRAQNSAFIKSLGEEGNRFLELVSELDMEKADASREYDKKQIKALVHKDLGGYSKLNENVIGAIRKFCVNSSLRELRTMNEEQKSTNNLLDNTALLLLDVGELETALQLFSESLSNKVRCFGTGHVSVATTYNNMGLVEEQLGNFQNALDLYQKSLEIKIKSLGEAHVSVAETYHNIAMVLDSQGKYQEALEMYQKALDIKIKCLGLEHVSVAATYKNMGCVEDALGNFQRALDLYQKALDIELKSLGGSHVSSASTRVNIGLVYNSLGDYEKALFEYNMALPVLEAALGPSHVSVATTKKNIGIVHGKRGDQGLAKQYYQEAYAIYLKSLGADHPETKGLAPFV